MNFGELPGSVDEIGRCLSCDDDITSTDVFNPSDTGAEFRSSLFHGSDSFHTNFAAGLHGGHDVLS
jgi:hypothetical protein